jgi:hypothetical protein
MNLKCVMGWNTLGCKTVCTRYTVEVKFIRIEQARQELKNWNSHVFSCQLCTSSVESSLDNLRQNSVGLFLSAISGYGNNAHIKN